MNQTRRALIVGINHYKSGPLDGCINDANNMYEVLNRNEDHSINFDCKLTISSEDPENEITIAKLKKQIYNLLHQEAEIAIFYFSGHGATNDDIGNYLVTQDTKEYQKGVSLNEIITMANSSKVREVVLILDCCYGGDLGNIKEIGGRKALLREGVSILTSSRDTQYAMETKGNQGLFTSIIYEALKGGAADILGNVTVSSVYSYVDQLLNSWKQRPIFKSHVSKMISLRKCTPKIELKRLRKLTYYFPNKDFKFPLDPSFDKNLDPKNKDHQEIMEYLREYYRLGLLIPIGEKYMYYAAKNSKRCELTAKGKYFWRLIANDRI